MQPQTPEGFHEQLRTYRRSNPLKVELVTDPARMIARFLRKYDAARGRGRSEAEARRQAEQLVGLDMPELATRQSCCWLAEIEGLGSPNTGPLTSLPRTAFEMVLTDEIRLAIATGWTATELFGVSTVDPENHRLNGIVHLIDASFGGVMPKSAKFTFGASRFTWPNGETREVRPIPDDGRAVPLWRHELFRPKLI